MLEILDDISRSFEGVNEKYSKGWTWGGNEAIISEIEKGFYKLPGKILFFRVYSKLRSTA
jgi:hypothetical protein